MVNYYQLHCHMKNSGVKIVVDNIFKCLKQFTHYNLAMLYSAAKAEYENEGIKAINIPSIDYDDTVFSSPEELDEHAHKIKNEILSYLDLSEKCIIHTHNVNLMKNTCLGRALQFIADENPEVKLIMQVHDFAEDNRVKLLQKMRNSFGKKDKEFAMKLAYPTGKNIIYCAINSRDKELLEGMGISKVFLFSNNINCDFFDSKPKTDGLIEKIAKYAKNKNYIFNPQRKILLSPLKIIERKNVIETLLILNKLNQIRDEWQLLISLDANSPADIEHSKKIKEFIRKHKLPVTIGFGFEFISPREERNKQFPYNLRDLFEIADVIITTSVKEGFGMSYLEGWVSKTPVVGRRLSYIFKDFESLGLDFKHFYEEILIKGKDFKEYSEKEKFKIVESKIEFQAENLINFIQNPNKEVIEKNRKIIIKEFSLESYHKKIIQMVEAESKPELIDNSNMIEYFKNENNNIK